MRVIAELDQRIEEARKLLALDELHLQRVTEAGLNTLNARDLVDRQQRYLSFLIKHHDRVVAHRLALLTHDGQSGSAHPEVPLPVP